tara:strand:- start:2418 stop:2630 length:213 start_codon:yes stop_codon:yes gene_type:complete
MSYVKLMIAVSSPFLLMGCETKTGALFSDVQRTPPALKPATADYIIRNDRDVAVWIGETKQKCEKFGCVQ